MNSIDHYPGLKAQLDPKGKVSKVETQERGGQTYVRVTQHFADHEGGQYLFKMAAQNAD
ncbi:hypothetical protein [Bradyrhizobium embrapense]|uniref:hypothetical protein n=1 Tax=Bradyrhizobium embrapense TaxID=630921 RepID=UPI000AE7586F|nr:hypothetical protein [Bradyrhizobium embrapense]